MVDNWNNQSCLSTLKEKGQPYCSLGNYRRHIEIIAGLIALMSPLLASYFSSLTIILMLGVLVIITGILHIFGGFRISSAYGSQWAWSSYLVGSLQLILGVIEIIYPSEPIPIVLLIAIIWYIITGILLLIDARIKRTQAIFEKEKITNYI